MEAGELFLGAVLSKAPHAAHEALLTLLPLPVQSRGKTRYRNHPGKPPGTRINSDVGNGMPRNPVPNPGDQPYHRPAQCPVHHGRNKGLWDSIQNVSSSNPKFLGSEGHKSIVPQY
ncbi:hypothetical protein PCASD_10388 [Puccinia coronata f. sp. avenae]|uniref:Uncharacterized protein n=1 Tax=Puccinia coronata f. sp. avenae TaxID=200324 RepID=A0A2N5US23_9BASI|nr:hypothetical protein PCASD_10388 [Puccinia coronata f. sp. avenae]